MRRDVEEAKIIAEAFEILLYACENIKGYDRCEDCPRRYMCLDDTDSSVIENADLVSESSWLEFIEYSDKASFSKADADAQYADMMRKIEREERMIDDEYGG